MIPKEGDRVYAWRPVVNAGHVERHRTPGTVEAVSRPVSWGSCAITVRMDDTGKPEYYGHWQLEPNEGVIPGFAQETS